MTLLELADACEKATGPDREMDAAIAVLTSGDKMARVVSPGPSSIFSHVPGWWRDASDKSHNAPTYTTSLDAATTLVPEGYCYTQGNKAQWKADESAWAWCQPDSFDWNEGWNSYAATPALALCAAALRARAAKATGAA